MRVLVLGAGQDVGKSCVVVRFGGRTFMFDCGMHLGYSDQRRFPDFSLLSPGANFNSVIDAVFITHFHLDHVGALPYFTEVCGYTGPIYMTYPTRAIAPLMLEDYHRVLMDRPGSGPLFAKHHIAGCMAKVSLLDLQETVEIFDGCEVTAYNAGHVLGAAIFYLKVGAESVVYTGDFNTVPDRHLAGASLGRLCPDLLISESTYAASIREGKLARESSLLAQIHETVSSGGKVLIPVFAVGRAQELMLLIDDHWDKTQLEVAIYMSGPMAARANQYYRLLLNWTSSRVKQGHPGARPTAFAFNRAQPWQPEYINQPGPCVLFATPGMLQGGTSLEVFKAWAPNPKNLVLLPSYQVAGTVGRKLMLGQRKGLLVDKTTLDVNCKVHYASISAHADAKGILQLIQQVSPAAVMLVHGEPDKMAFMQSKVQNSLGINCYMPAIADEVEINSKGVTEVPVAQQLLRRLPMSVQLLQERWQQQQQQQQQEQAEEETAGQRSLHHDLQQQQDSVNHTPEAGRIRTSDIGAAAAGWLQQGDVGNLVDAAQKLAGLDIQTTSTATASAAAAAAADVHGSKQQQVPVTAAARAEQLAPWLELLAAAAQGGQQTPGQQQPQLSSEQQEEVQPLQGSSQVHGDQTQQQYPQLLTASTPELQQPFKPLLSSNLATLSLQLQQQLSMETHHTVLEGVLVVKHLPPKVPAEQPLVQSMQLLPAGHAAALLGLQQHKLKQTCRIKIPRACCMRQLLQPEVGLKMQQQQQQQQQEESGHAQQQQQPEEQRRCDQQELSKPVPLQPAGADPHLSADNALLKAAAAFVAEMLQAGLPGPLAQQIQLQHCRVQLRSITLNPVNMPDQDASSDVCVRCSWQVSENALAQQCMVLLQLAD